MKQSPLKKELLYLHSAAGNTNKPDQRQRLYFLCDIIHIFIRKCNCDYFSTREILSPHSRDFVPPLERFCPRYISESHFTSVFHVVSKSGKFYKNYKNCTGKPPPVANRGGVAYNWPQNHPKKTLEKENQGRQILSFFKGIWQRQELTGCTLIEATTKPVEAALSFRG